MPKRKIPLVNEEIYHVFNRSVAQQPIFHNRREYSIFLNALEYYRFFEVPFRYSHYERLNSTEKTSLLNRLYSSNNAIVDIYTFCLMPNHYHLLVKQITNNGVSNFIRLLQNSYARYQNIKSKRYGSLFQSPFKAVRIENDNQFVHVARYIHLNPLTSFVLRDPKELYSYDWSSWLDYSSGKSRAFIDTSFLLKLIDKDKLENFTFDQLDYQRKLENIKHLIVE